MAEPGNNLYDLRLSHTPTQLDCISHATSGILKHFGSVCNMTFMKWNVDFIAHGSIWYNYNHIFIFTNINCHGVSKCMCIRVCMCMYFCLCYFQIDDVVSLFLANPCHHEIYSFKHTFGALTMLIHFDDTSIIIDKMYATHNTPYFNLWYLLCLPEMRDTKPISHIPSFSQIFKIINTSVTLWISRYFFITSAELRWHVLHVNVIHVLNVNVIQIIK